MQRASREFADLPSREGAPVARSRDMFNAGFNSDRLGYFGASLIRQRARGEQREAFASVNWQRAIGSNLSLNVSGNMGLRGGSARGLFLTVSYSPGQRDHLSASVQSGRRRTSGSVSYRHSLPLEGGIEVGHRHELREAEKTGQKAARYGELLEEYRRLMNPVRTANAFGVEEIIDPKNTRRVCCSWARQVYQSMIPERLENRVAGKIHPTFA